MFRLDYTAGEKKGHRLEKLAFRAEHVPSGISRLHGLRLPQF